jgi:ABC-type Fe3+/spermidine/putrescine transport system ATPase subunit
MKMKNYSSGMYVRLAFSVAIQADAPILLVDEVLAVGDANFQQKCFNVFERYKKERKTIVLVTHDLKTIERWCDKAILVESGKKLYSGEPKKIIENYNQEKKETIKIKINKTRLEGKDWINIDEKYLSGKKDVKIIKYKVEPKNKKVGNNSKIVIKMAVNVKKDIDEAIVGYLVYKKNEIPLFGNNSLDSRLNFIKLEKNKRYIITIAFIWPNVVKDEYLITIGIGEGNNVENQIVQCWANKIIKIINEETDSAIIEMMYNRIKNLSIEEIQ